MRAWLAGLAVVAALGLGTEAAVAMPAVEGVEIDRTPHGRVTVRAELGLPASEGRHRVLVAVEAFRREDRHGLAQDRLERRQRWIAASHDPSTRTVRFRLGARASRYLTRRGLFDQRHSHADRQRRTTARELVTVHVRAHRDADGSGPAELLEVAGADGWHRPAAGASASGTGAVIAIRNNTAEPVAISTTPINCMYDRGEEGSNLYMLNGTLPAPGSASAYVEGNAGLASIGISPIGAYSTMVDWLKLYGAKLGVAATIGAYASDAIAKALAPVTFFEKSCALSPSLFGVVATGKQSGQWALAVYQLGKNQPRSAVRMADWSSGGAVRIGDTVGSGSALTIPVG